MLAAHAPGYSLCYTRSSIVVCCLLVELRLPACASIVKCVLTRAWCQATTHGFRRNFSCATLLFALTADIHTNMEEDLQTHCAFLDYSKAFDLVAHCRLILKLSALKLNSLTITCIRNFLSNLQQFRAVIIIFSPLWHVILGVLQGNVLGQLLFLIHINDLLNNISSHVRIFADNCIRYRSIGANDHRILQKDLELLFGVTLGWWRKLNVSKCKISSFSRKHTNATFFIT